MKKWISVLIKTFFIVLRHFLGHTDTSHCRVWSLFVHKIFISASSLYWKKKKKMRILSNQWEWGKFRKLCRFSPCTDCTLFVFFVSVESPCAETKILNLSVKNKKGCSLSVYKFFVYKTENWTNFLHKKIKNFNCAVCRRSYTVYEFYLCQNH